MAKVEVTKSIPKGGKDFYAVGEVLDVNAGLAVKWEATGHAKPFKPETGKADRRVPAATETRGPADA